MGSNAPPLTTNGIATSFDFRPLPITHDMNSKNVQTVLIEMIGPASSLGTWLASGWPTDETMSYSLYRFYKKQMGPQLAETIRDRLAQEQSVTVNGKQFVFSLRPTRAYKPFSFTL